MFLSRKKSENSLRPSSRSFLDVLTRKKEINVSDCKKSENVSNCTKGEQIVKRVKGFLSRQDGGKRGQVKFSLLDFLRIADSSLFKVSLRRHLNHHKNISVIQIRAI